ncbi:MAG: type I restriction enzyme HsdR N-terminal domain-containing protein [Bacteroidales bacterium]|nr:type I restriction enzyme HsdR N-terminal domain-containing protein [Bacteroidales bacterium]
MMKLNLPQYDFIIKNEGDKSFIFDALRKKFVTLTPEEEVRQRFVATLINQKGYPAGRIGNEISLNLNNTKRRCDTVVYDKFGSPCVIIEYKAPNIEITQEVFNQITRYNYVLRVSYIIVTNGIRSFCCKIDYSNKSYNFLKEIPFYNEIENCI